MNIYRDISEIEYNRDTIVSLGTFDGVHKGHQKIINRLNEIARQDNLRPLIITMDPHPRIVLQNPDKPKIQLLTSIKERLDLFQKFGVENVFIIHFTYEFSQTSPEEFIKNYLVDKIGLKKFLMGREHFFGRNRQGSYVLLLEYSQKYDFEIEKVEDYVEDDIVVSSTKIRHLLLEAGVATAIKFLGYPYIVRGKVVHGNGRGATIGYPTANIKPYDAYKLLPGDGVYLVSTEIDGKKLFGMANIGTRPTVTVDTKPTLEVHFFDFSDDLYDREIAVNFHYFIREEKKFKNIDELSYQIEKDELKCRDLIDEHNLLNNLLNK